METIEAMLRSHPNAMETPELSGRAEALQSLAVCAQVCTACADACLGEASRHLPQLRRCIRANLDCADVCQTTARLLSRQTDTPWDLLHEQLSACIEACQVCGDECATHAEMHEHCRICADTCHHCQEACNRALGAISSSPSEEPVRPFESPPLS